MCLMKKKRYLPFGYCIQKGKIAVLLEEKQLIEKIYMRYLEGFSLIKLVTVAEQSKLKFRESTDVWNKNMIARILDDNRYWSHLDFPPILNAELADKVALMRKQKSTPKSPVWVLQKKLVCAHCGSKLTRYSKNAPKVYWNCKGCGIRIGSIKDEDLLHSITSKMVKLCHNPLLAEPDALPERSVSLQAVRFSNEIDQELSQRSVDADKLLALIQECAQEKYRQCNIVESDHLTHLLKRALGSQAASNTFNQELLNQTTDKVILHSDCSVQLRLINQKIF